MDVSENSISHQPDRHAMVVSLYSNILVTYKQPHTLLLLCIQPNPIANIILKDDNNKNNWCKEFKHLNLGC